MGRPANPPSRRVLFLGGARSGKSAAAEARAHAVAGPGGSVTYLAPATARPDDPEWTARIAAHRARRPATWRTVEDADPIPTLRAGGVVLVDCLSLWLARVLEASAPAVEQRCTELVAAWAAAPGYVIAVSSEVGMGVVPATAAGRRFRDELGRLNAAVAAASDEVALVVAGRLLPLVAP